MNFIALLEQKFREIGAVLACYASYKSALRHSFCLWDKLKNFHESNSTLGSRCERHSELFIEWIVVCQTPCSFSFCCCSALKRFQSFEGMVHPVARIAMDHLSAVAYLIKAEGCVCLVGRQKVPNHVATPSPRRQDSSIRIFSSEECNLRVAHRVSLPRRGSTISSRPTSPLPSATASSNSANGKHIKPNKD